MADTVTRYPTTPAEIAAAVLDKIESHPAAFDMDNWVSLTDGSRLAPAQAPTCGTQLCAAGWVAHVTGWTLVDLPSSEEEEVTTTDCWGAESTTRTNVYAEKNGERRLICDVARTALGLTEGQTFWYEDAETALERLREIAGR